MLQLSRLASLIGTIADLEAVASRTHLSQGWVCRRFGHRRPEHHGPTSHEVGMRKTLTRTPHQKSRSANRV
jgi:hypothetical protein